MSDFDLDDGGNAREWFYGGLLQGNLFGGWCAINRDAVDHWSPDQHRHSGRDGVRPGEQYSVLQYITPSAGP